MTNKSQILWHDLTQPKYISCSCNVYCQCGYLSRAAVLHVVAPILRLDLKHLHCNTCSYDAPWHGKRAWQWDTSTPKCTYHFCLYFTVQSKHSWPVLMLYLRQIRALIPVCPKVEMNWVLVNSGNIYYNDLMELLG